MIYINKGYTVLTKPNRIMFWEIKINLYKKYIPENKEVKLVLAVEINQNE
jgi:hypothetical protein